MIPDMIAYSNCINELNSGEVTFGHIMVSRYGIVHLLSG